VCCRSPIIPARPAYSGEMLNMSASGDLDSTNIWVNPLNGSLTSTLGASTNSILPGPRFKVSARILYTFGGVTSMELLQETYFFVPIFVP